MTFTIGSYEIQKRKKNILLGLGYSIALALVIGYANGSGMESYNDFLLGSVVFFLVSANIINGYRHLQWLKLITTHRVEEAEGSLNFYKGTERSTLKSDNIAQLIIKRKKGALITIIVVLNIGNKIRLEGYDDMEGLLTVLKKIASDQVKIKE
ncbi:MAG: hypothetical protein HQL67_01680 [Magnetococcales bacterium]|nr:hypothetical protein [Magnetococcales bacterium]